jgi:hypothetical protein
MSNGSDTHTAHSPAAERAGGGAAGTFEQRFDFSQILAVLLTGLSIGWLVGLSRSPVVAASIASLFALAGAMVAALHGIRPLGTSVLKYRSGNAWPVALLVLSVAIGASAGNLARTNDLLGRIGPPREGGSQRDDPADRTGLFSLTTTECGELMVAGQKSIRTIFRSSTHDELRSLGEQIEDPEVLKKIATALCAD